MPEGDADSGLPAPTVGHREPVVQWVSVKPVAVYPRVKLVPELTVANVPVRLAPVTTVNCAPVAGVPTVVIVSVPPRAFAPEPVIP